LTAGKRLPTIRTTHRSERMRSVLLALASFLFLALPTAAQEEKLLNVYNWSDYIAEDTLKKFTEHTGIKVNYDVYDSNEILEAKLSAGRSGYDLVFPTSSPFFARQVKAGLYQRIDRTRLKNFARIDRAVLERLKAADPDNAHGLPYMMAGTGVGYNVDKLKELAPDAPIGSLALLFDRKHLFRLKGCGISVLDAPEEVLPAALAYIGRDPTSSDSADLDAAVDVVTKARLNYRYIHSSAYINDLANGATCLAMGYAGDLVQARDRAIAAKRGVNVGVFLPSEGTAFNIDVMAIPRDAPHPGNAHLFIDFLLEPEIIAAISNAVGYANAIPDSSPMVRRELRQDPVVYPPTGLKLYSNPEVSKDFERARNRAWSRIKAKRS
jgi:putrescine transport system substrate-binding protein